MSNIAHSRKFHDYDTAEIQN
jgi:hypothetical protein